jgi:hypothetical protein
MMEGLATPKPDPAESVTWTYGACPFCNMLFAHSLLIQGRSRRRCPGAAPYRLFNPSIWEWLALPSCIFHIDDVVPERGEGSGRVVTDEARAMPWTLLESLSRTDWPACRKNVAPGIAYWREWALKAALRAALATFLSG